MALTDLPTVKTFLSIPSTDTSQDAWLGLLLRAADTIIKNYVKRDLETPTTAYTEYKDGSGVIDLALLQRPVQLYTLTGNLSAGSPTITNIASTTGLVANLAVITTANPAQLAASSNIQSVDSGTQITLTKNALLSATAAAFIVGPAVYLDAGGLYGQGTGGFASTMQLQLGLDYALKLDGASTSSTLQTSASGLLRRLGGGPTASVLGGGWPFGWEMRRGTLTARAVPGWASWYGNIKAIYIAGLGIGPASSGGSLPLDLTDAANMLVAWMRRSGPAGAGLQQENLGRYSYALRNPAAGEGPEIGTIRQLLSRYREVATGGV